MKSVKLEPNRTEIPINQHQVSQYVIRTQNPQIPFGLGDHLKDIPAHHNKWIERIMFWSEVRKSRPIIMVFMLATIAGCSYAIYGLSR